MSNAQISFEQSIQEAKSILKFYDDLNKENKNSKELEVLKRAGLVIALSAWETYVEDRVEEEVQTMLNRNPDLKTSRFMKNKLEIELKGFHNPNSEKTNKLFLDYLDIDISEKWCVNGLKPNATKAKLNKLLEKRGEAAHRAKIKETSKNPDLIKIEELRKAVSFLEGLVKAIDKALDEALG